MMVVVVTMVAVTTGSTGSGPGAADGSWTSPRRTVTWAKAVLPAASSALRVTSVSSSCTARGWTKEPSGKVRTCTDEPSIDIQTEASASVMPLMYADGPSLSTVPFTRP